MHYHKASILITPLLILGLYEIFYLNPPFIYIGLFISNLLVAYTIRNLARSWNIKNWWDYCILPVFFISSLAIYTSLLINDILIQVLFIANFLFIFYYFKNLYFYFGKQAKYRYIIQNFSSYGNFLIVFFLAAVIFGLQAFLDVPLWLLIGIFTVVMLLVIYEVLVTNEIEIRPRLHFIFLLTLLMAEFAGAVYFFPFNYNVLGLIVAICYYISIGIIKFHLKNSLNPQAIKLYLTAGIASIVVVLLTTQWL